MTCRSRAAQRRRDRHLWSQSAAARETRRLADDFERHLVQQDRLARDRRPRARAALPVGVADHGNGSDTGMIVGSRQQTVERALQQLDAVGSSACWLAAKV